MFIQTEPTPNPDVMKFIPGREVTGAGGARSFSSVASARGVSPLAVRLFLAGDVKGVFLGPDFISVTREGGADWRQMKPAVLAAIMEHFLSDEPVVHMTGEGETADGNGAAEGETEVVLKIRELLDSRVRPMVAQDGGDITFERFEDGVVYLRMRGACSGCPSSVATLKYGVENLLRHYIPEVQAVEQA